MTEDNKQVRRLQKIARELNVGTHTIVEFLAKKGRSIDPNPNTKVPDDVYGMLLSEFQTEKSVKEKSKTVSIGATPKKAITIDEAEETHKQANAEEVIEKELLIKNVTASQVEERVEEMKPKIKVLGKMDLGAKPKVAEPAAPVAVEPEKPKAAEVKQEEKPAEKAPEKKEAEQVISAEKAAGEIAKDFQVKVLGKMDLDAPKSKKPSHEKHDKPAHDKNEKPQHAKKHEKGDKPHAEKPVEKKAHTPEAPKAPEVEVVPTPAPEQAPEAAAAAEQPDNFLKTEYTKLEGPTILGKIVLPTKAEHKKQPIASSSASFDANKKKKKRKRIKPEGAAAAPGTPGQGGQGGQGQGGHGKPNQGGQGAAHAKPGDRPARPNQGGQGGGANQGGQGQGGGKFKPNFKNNQKGHQAPAPKAAPTDEDIQRQIKETLARLSGGSNKSKASKYRRQKRENISQQKQDEMDRQDAEQRILKVTEFVTANELATLMDVPVTKVISSCMSLGIFVSINQRLDAETLTIVAEEFGFEVEFISVELQESIKEEEEKPEDLQARPPIVTVMGHVDHGKTSLLDHIRKANVIAGEAGGITQHIGAYSVFLENGKQITFLDTPGHEAFTAMRARGAQVTDIAIIVISADDSVMPQTVEAINHAQAAGVPIVFAINKIDKAGANPDKIREALANMNLLVEEWGGKYQCQEISAKKGLNIDALLEKVLLEAEMLELKADPDRNASGSVIESELDKGRGYVSTILVQKGTLRIGDAMLAGCYFGKVKAMYNERNQPIKEAGPSIPVQILGLNGAPQAGDKFNVMEEREAKNIATKRQQLQREQGIRTQKHVTLDEIGRRIAIGDFKELNVIVKGDVDGSIEALSDSLLKLSTPKIQVNVIHKSVGGVTESDVLLASASNAIIIAFQVRPSLSAKKLAEKEEIDIRTYSIIYDAINELRDAMEGMLSPEIQEKIVCNVEIREIFKVSKVGTIAGCLVLEGKINRNTKIRIIRDGIVVYTGTLGSLKRYKDDAKEVHAGMECGLNINNFNDIKVGDIVEGYDEIEVKAKL